MADLIPVYDELRHRLEKYADGLLETNNPTDANAAGSRKVEAPDDLSYTLLGAATKTYPDGQYFAGLRVGRRYVSVYLMSLYLVPGGDAGISDALAKRRQGKSCFNFTTVDDDLFDELEELLVRGKQQFADAGLLRTP